MTKQLLFIADGLGSGGAERQMVTIACLLKNSGYSVQFLCYSKGDFYGHILRDKDIPIEYILEKKSLSRMLKIRRYIRKNHFDATISFVGTADFLNNFAAIGKHDWKVITGIRHTGNKDTSTKGKLYLWFQRYCDCIVFNSDFAKKKWVQNYPQYANKFRIIYNVVTLGKIDTTYIPRQEGITHILVAASCYSLKNPMGVVKAIQLMTPEERKLFRIEWFGKLPKERDLTGESEQVVKAIEENHFENVFLLEEHTKDIANKMNQADVVALFSSEEGLPNVICEGMLLGKPIIMSRVSDYDVLVDKSNGKLCDWDNPQSIKDAILSMANLTEEELFEMGKNSKAKAKHLFSSDTIVRQWESLL